MYGLRETVCAAGPLVKSKHGKLSANLKQSAKKNIKEREIDRNKIKKVRISKSRR